MKELRAASRRKGLAPWQEKRLTVVRLVATGKLTAAEIAQACGVSRDSLFDYLRCLFKHGVKGLLKRGDYGGNRAPRMDTPTRQAFIKQVRKGAFRRAKDARLWLRERHVELALPTCYYWLKKSLRGVESAS
jgi:transposase-like protein